MSRALARRPTHRARIIAPSPLLPLSLRPPGARRGGDLRPLRCWRRFSNCAICGRTDDTVGDFRYREVRRMDSDWWPDSR